MDILDDVHVEGRVTRSLRKRLASVDSETSLSRPDTPVGSKLNSIAELSSPLRSARRSRRNSTSETTPAKTPGKTSQNRTAALRTAVTREENSPLRRATTRFSTNVSIIGEEEGPLNPPTTQCETLKEENSPNKKENQLNFLNKRLTRCTSNSPPQPTLIDKTPSNKNSSKKRVSAETEAITSKCSPRSNNSEYSDVEIVDLAERDSQMKAEKDKVDDTLHTVKDTQTEKETRTSDGKNVENKNYLKYIEAKAKFELMKGLNDEEDNLNQTECNTNKIGAEIYTDDNLLIDVDDVDDECYRRGGDSPVDVEEELDKFGKNVIPATKQNQSSLIITEDIHLETVTPDRMAQYFNTQNEKNSPKPCTNSPSETVITESHKCVSFKESLGEDSAKISYPKTPLAVRNKVKIEKNLLRDLYIKTSSQIMQNSSITEETEEEDGKENEAEDEDEHDKEADKIADSREAMQTGQSVAVDKAFVQDLGTPQKTFSSLVQSSTPLFVSSGNKHKENKTKIEENKTQSEEILTETNITNTDAMKKTEEGLQRISILEISNKKVNNTSFEKCNNESQKATNFSIIACQQSDEESHANKGKFCSPKKKVSFASSWSQISIKVGGKIDDISVEHPQRLATPESMDTSVDSDAAENISAEKTDLQMSPTLSQDDKNSYNEDVENDAERRNIEDDEPMEELAANEKPYKTCSYVCDEVNEANCDYQSGDSMDSEERREMKENEIPIDGESIGSGDTTENEIEDEENEEDDASFIDDDSEVENEKGSCSEPSGDDEHSQKTDKILNKEYKRILLVDSSDNEQESVNSSPENENEKDNLQVQRSNNGSSNMDQTESRNESVQELEGNDSEDSFSSEGHNKSDLQSKENEAEDSFLSKAKNESVHESNETEVNFLFKAEPLSAVTKRSASLGGQNERCKISRKSLSDCRSKRLSVSCRNSAFSSGKGNGETIVKGNTSLKRSSMGASTSKQLESFSSKDTQGNQEANMSGLKENSATDSDSDSDDNGNDNVKNSKAKQKLSLCVDPSEDLSLSIEVSAPERTSVTSPQAYSSSQEDEDIIQDDHEEENFTTSNTKLAELSTEEEELLRQLTNEIQLPKAKRGRHSFLNSEVVAKKITTTTEIKARNGNKKKRRTIGVGVDSEEFNPSQSLIENITHCKEKLNENNSAKRKRLSKSFCEGNALLDRTENDEVRHHHKKLKHGDSMTASTETMTTKKATQNPDPDRKNHIQRILGRCDEILEAANLAKLEAKQNYNKNKKKVLKQKKMKKPIVEPVTNETKTKTVEQKLKRKAEIEKALKASANIILRKPLNKPVVSQDEGSSAANDYSDSVPRVRKSKKSKASFTSPIATDFDQINPKHANKIKSSAGEVIEMPITEKNPYHDIQLSTGTVHVEPVTPQNQHKKSGFRESLATPRSLGFKVRHILTAGQDTPPEIPRVLSKEKKGKRKIEEPKNTLPKSQWTQSGIFIEEDLYPSIPVANTRSTEFMVHVLNDGRKRKKVSVTNVARSGSIVKSSSCSSALLFKHNALFRDDIRRENSHEIILRKQRQQHKQRHY